MMSTTNLRLDLKQMIDNETDPQILKAVKMLLQKNEIGPGTQGKTYTQSFKIRREYTRGKNL